MRNLREINLEPTPARRPASAHLAQAESLTSELERSGVVMLPSLLTAEQLRGMKSAFAARLKRLFESFMGELKQQIRFQVRGVRDYRDGDSDPRTLAVPVREETSS